MKPTIFIGSSSKSLQVAKAIQQCLQDDFLVTVWDALFKIGDYFLEALQKELLFTDFGLFILFPDDRIEKKDEHGFTSRDNVIFELGMHVGALGMKRANFVLIDANQNGKKLRLTVPSDLDGIKKLHVQLEIDDDYSFKKIDANDLAIKDVCQVIKELFLEVSEDVSLTFLPSTALALGYYRNFILPACIELLELKNIVIDKYTYQLKKNSFDFYIVIPNNGQKSSLEMYNKFVRDNHLGQITLRSNKSPRSFPFFIRANKGDGKIQLYDMPTTLRSSWETIRLVIPGNSKKEIERLEQKEIFNFVRTLNHLLAENDSLPFKDKVHIIFSDQIKDIL